MAAEDILIKLSFVLKNQRAVDNATKRLQKIGMASNLATTKITKFGDKGTQSMFRLGTSANMTGDQWNGMEKSVNSNAKAIGKYKSTTSGAMQVVSKRTQAVGSRFSYLNSRLTRTIPLMKTLRKVSMAFTWAAMSMLGVFFSTMSVMMVMGIGFNLIAGGLFDLEKGIEKVVTGLALAEASGIDTHGMMEKFTEGIDDNVDAWMNIQGLSGMLSATLTMLGREIFKDDVFVQKIADSIALFAEALSDPEIIESIRSVILAFADALPGIAKVVPTIAKAFEMAAPFAPLLIMLAGIAAILMPLLSILAAGMYAIAMASGVAGPVLDILLLIFGALKFVVLALAAALGAPVWAIAAIIAAIVLVISYFGWWDDIINGLIDTLKFMYDCVANLINLLMTGTWLERLGAITSLISGPVGWTIGGTLAGDRGRTSKTDITQSTTINVGEVNSVADWDEVMERGVSEMNNSIAGV